MTDFKEFFIYYFPIKLSRLNILWHRILTRTKHCPSTPSTTCAISKSIDKQQDRGKQYNQLTGRVMNYHRALVRFIETISVYLAQILVHTAKTLVTSRARLLPRYIICICFIVPLPFRHCRNIVSIGHLASLLHPWWLWNMI